ncbi:MAG: leucine-rich repeat protein [Clostridia bacterium]|nr:leucine-rich repeat protein [Clostridia bacterium]
MKRIVYFMLAVAMCIGCFAAFSPLASAYRKGHISSYVVWTFYDNGQLKFSGTGTAHFPTITIPSACLENTKEIVLIEGMTGLLFDTQNLPNLEKVTLPSTCTEVRNVPYESFKFKEYVVSAGNNAYKAVDGVLFERNTEENGIYKNTYTLKHYPQNKSNQQYTISSDVTAVGEQAFRNNRNLKKLVFADTVKVIERQAFMDSKALSAVEFPFSLEEMGDSAFRGCSALKSADIVGPIEKLGDSAFYGCTSLERISLPSTLEILGQGCFEGCRSLKNIDLSFVKNIGTNGLYNCHSLESLELPADFASGKPTSYSYCGATNVYDSFLGNNYKLKEIKVDSNNPHYSSVNGVLYSKDKTIIYCYPAGKTDKVYTMLESTLYVSDHTFAGAKCLESLNFYGIQGAFNSFEGNDSLKKLVVKSEAVPFMDFEIPALEVLELSPQIKGIFNLNHFHTCTKLPEELVLPSGIYDFLFTFESFPFKTIYIFKSKELFENGETISPITYCLVNTKERLAAEGIELIRLDEEGKCGENARFTLDKNGKLVIKGSGVVDSYPWQEYPQFIKEVVIDEGISGIGALAFEGCAVKKLSLPSTLTEIDATAFNGCDSLKTVIDRTQEESLVKGNPNLAAATCVRIENGDANGDGLINSIDAAFVLRYDAGILQTIAAGDVSTDGVINSIDAALILKHDAGMF